MLFVGYYLFLETPLSLQSLIDKTTFVLQDLQKLSPRVFLRFLSWELRVWQKVWVLVEVKKFRIWNPALNYFFAFLPHLSNIKPVKRHLYVYMFDDQLSLHEVRFEVFYCWLFKIFQFYSEPFCRQFK